MQSQSAISGCVPVFNSNWSYRVLHQAGCLSLQHPQASTPKQPHSGPPLDPLARQGPTGGRADPSMLLIKRPSSSPPKPLTRPPSMDPQAWVPKLWCTFCLTSDYALDALHEQAQGDLSICFVTMQASVAMFSHA